MILVAICGLIFLGAAFVALSFAMERESQRMSGRFTAVSAAANEDLPEDMKGSLRERIWEPMRQRLNALAERMTPASSVRGISLWLERAGRPWGLTPPIWTLIRFVTAIGGMTGFMLVMRVDSIPGMMRLCAGLAVAAAGLIGPSTLLDMKVKERQGTVRVALPDVIDLLVVSVEAGLGLDAAVQEVITRRSGPLMDELGRVLAEVRVGKQRRMAWQEMAARVDVTELKVFVAALVQAEELGASVAGVLRSQSDSLRVRRSLAVREMAAVLPVKMLFPLIFFIFPSMFVVILGPGMIKLMTTFKAIGF